VLFYTYSDNNILYSYLLDKIVLMWKTSFEIY